MIGYSCYWVDTTTNGGPTTTSLTNFEEWTIVEETNTSQTGKNGRCSYSRGALIGRPIINSHDRLGVALWPYSIVHYSSIIIYGCVRLAPILKGDTPNIGICRTCIRGFALYGYFVHSCGEGTVRPYYGVPTLKLELRYNVFYRVLRSCNCS